MRSTFTRGARRLLVTAGVMILGLAVVVPTSAGAHHEDGHTRGAGPETDLSHGDESDEASSGDTDALDDAAGDVVTGPQGAERIWVCHVTPGRGNPWELIHITVDAWAGHGHHEHDVIVDEDDIMAAVEAAEAEGVTIDLRRSDLNRRHDEELARFIDGVCGELPADPEVDEPEVEVEIEEPEVEVDDPEVDPEVDEPEVEVEVDDPEVEVEADEPVTPTEPNGPATPPAEHPLGDRPVKPIVISTDSVTEPLAPAVPRTSETEVLGSVTTRTPSQVAGGMQTLPRTGTDLTTVLAVAGIALLLAGVGLEAAGRRSPRRGTQLSA